MGLVGGMRTQEEIIHRYQTLRPDSVVPWRLEILVHAMTFTNAKKLGALLPAVVAADWNRERLITDSDWWGRLKMYADKVAWGLMFKKERSAVAQNPRSYERAIQRIDEMLWLLGREDLMSEMRAIEFFPDLGEVKLCWMYHALGWPIPEDTFEADEEDE